MDTKEQSLERQGKKLADAWKKSSEFSSNSTLGACLIVLGFLALFGGGFISIAGAVVMCTGILVTAIRAEANKILAAMHVQNRQNQAIYQSARKKQKGD